MKDGPREDRDFYGAFLEPHKMCGQCTPRRVDRNVGKRTGVFVGKLPS